MQRRWALLALLASCLLVPAVRAVRMPGKHGDGTGALRGGRGSATAAGGPEEQERPRLQQRPLKREQEPPHHTILTNATFMRALRGVATRNNEVIFTTFMFFPILKNKTFLPVNATSHSQPINMLRHHYWWLHKNGLMNNFMLLTADERTWRILYNEGIPSFLDQTFPRSGGYDGKNTEPGVHKYWTALQATKAGYKALALDYDATVLKDPLQPFSLPYDLQTLSAWKEPELPLQLETLDRTCGIYLHVIDTKYKLGAMIREYTAVMPGNFTDISGKTPNASTPCASSGVMYFRPARATTAFLQAMLYRLLEHAPGQWEAAALNEMLLHFTWGIGDQPPVRFRLLPVEQYTNIGVFEQRRLRGMYVDPAIIHTGDWDGYWKQHAYMQQRLWQGTFKPPLQPDPLAWGLRETGGAVLLLLATPFAAAWGLPRLRRWAGSGTRHLKR